MTDQNTHREKVAIIDANHATTEAAKKAVEDCGLECSIIISSEAVAFRLMQTIIEADVAYVLINSNIEMTPEEKGRSKLIQSIRQALQGVGRAEDSIQFVWLNETTTGDASFNHPDADYVINRSVTGSFFDAIKDVFSGSVL